MIRNWEYTYGDKTIPITANDVVETLGRVLAREYHHALNDEKTKSHVQMKILHEVDDLILEVMRGVFSDVIVEDSKKHPHMKNPGGKRK